MKLVMDSIHWTICYEAGNRILIKGVCGVCGAHFWKCNFPMNHNVCLTVCLSVCRSVGTSVGLSVCLSVCVSVCLSFCLSVCPKKNSEW